MKRSRVRGLLRLLAALATAGAPACKARAPASAPDAAPAVDPAAASRDAVIAGRRALDEGRVGEAYAAFERAAALDPKNAFAHANLGTLAAEDGQLERAVAAFARAVEADPAHAGFREEHEKLSAIAAGGGKLLSASDAQIGAVCTRCHKLPDPSVLPRAAWGPILADMAELAGGFGPLDPRVVDAWYRLRSPLRLELPPSKAGLAHTRLPLARRPFAPNPAAGHPAIANVRFIDAVGDKRLELIATDMRAGLVLIGLPYSAESPLFVVGRIPHPAHVEPVDLDLDGKTDLLVADLGTFVPAVTTKGGVYWLRQRDDGTYEQKLLYAGLGRVADARAADFDGDGDLDLVVAEFGSRAVGRVLLLENTGFGPKGPKLVPRTLDERSGAIHVPIADLDGDGRPDFAVLHAEQHETIAVHLNRGRLNFEKRDLYSAPHPSWGFTGLELADMDGDGDLDLISSNGDGFDGGGDAGGLLQPFHGCQVFENRGGLELTERAHLRLLGAHRCAPSDLDGDGRLDLIGVAFQPFLSDEGRRALEVDGVVWFRRSGPWTFERNAIEAYAIEHTTADAADYDRDGDVDVAVGVFVMERVDESRRAEGGVWGRAPSETRSDWIHVYENTAKAQ